MIYERRAPTTLYADSAGSPRGTQRRPCDARSLGSHRMERQPAPAAWPLREQLLLAQIVHQDGHVPPNWASVSTHITSHPCVKETPRARSADTCERVWTALMQTHVPSDTVRTDRGAQIALAQRLYAARLEELVSDIAVEDKAFHELHEKIEGLRAGRYDDELQKHVQVKAPSEPAKTEAASTEPVVSDVAETEEEAPDDDDDLQVEQDLLGDTADPSRADMGKHAAPPPSTTTYSTRVRKRSRVVAASSSPASSPELPAHTPRSHRAEEDESVSDAERDKSRRRTTQLLLMLHNQVSNHTHANLFDQPIKEMDAPNYYTVIKQPMDLKLMKQRIKEGAITSSMDLRRAFSLMFANALMYNHPGTEVHRMANEMRVATDEILDEFDRTPLGS